MNVVWDTYNNWGLRAAFNSPETHTIVPWFAWDRPLRCGSDAHPRWGMNAIRDSGAVCVNGMWQTSAAANGPSARSQVSWKPCSLVRTLVAATLARCSRNNQPNWWLWKEDTVDAVVLRVSSAYFTIEEKAEYSQVKNKIIRQIKYKRNKLETKTKIIRRTRNHNKP